MSRIFCMRSESVSIVGDISGDNGSIVGSVVNPRVHRESSHVDLALRFTKSKVLLKSTGESIECVS